MNTTAPDGPVPTTANNTKRNAKKHDNETAGKLSDDAVLAHLATQPEPEKVFERLVSKGRVQNPDDMRKSLKSKGYKL